jgi:hypothetical protein
MSKRLTVLVLAGLLLAAATGAPTAATAVAADEPVAVTTGVGNGADTALENDGQSGNHGPDSLHGADTYIAVRRYDGTRQKMLYVRFDLSALGGHLSQAILTFNLTSSNRTRTWAIYGLVDESLDNWDEATICYNNAPGMLPAAIASYAIDETKLRRLCTMNVVNAVGVYSSPVDPSMDQFLSEDTNGLVSFLVLPDTTDQNASYYVSSKENTTVAANLAPTITGVVVNATRATQAKPANKATDVSRDVVLGWRPSEGANKFNVYLGQDLEAVTAADASVLVSPGQDANSYDPPGHLEFGKMYYWRIDEVGGTSSTGAVWQFEVEPKAYAIANVTATASSVDPATNVQNTANGQGLTLNAADPNKDAHGMLDNTLWRSNKTATGRPWIQFAFDRVYKLYEMWVWNYNGSMEDSLGVGAKEVTIEYSTDGLAWTTLDAAAIFNQGPGSDGYDHNTTVSFGGAAAQYVKLTIQSNWGTLPQCGLSEVRFFQIPVQAAVPAPASAATNVDPRTLVLRWKAGREAVSHQVYLGTDRQAVADGTAPVVTTDQATYTPTAPLLNTTYYWKVVEVNNAETPGAWASDVWSFSARQTLSVEDFEIYTNKIGNCVFETWIDGTGTDEIPGNGTGSTVGLYPDAVNGTFCDTTVFHDGRQSMPLAYTNSGATLISEAVRTFDDPQDWSKYGITTLVLWFRGDVNNTPAPLYVKINNTKIQYNNGASATTVPLWKQWNIDLTSLSATVKSVKTFTIGIGDGKTTGTGTIQVDDIRLYVTAPPVAVPVDPGTTGLVALYALEGNVQDASGKGNNGTASGNPVYVSGPKGYGQALKFDGLDDYVTLPIGTALSTMNDITVAALVNFGATAGVWQRVFDFGTGTTNYMFLTPSRSGTDSSRFAILTPAITAEQGITAPAALSVGWHHLAVVINSATMTATLYIDGASAGSTAVTVLPKNLGVTTQNWIGRSQWTTDAYLNSTLDDFRIYNVALTEGQIRYLAGDR